MSIVIRLDVMMARRKVRANALARAVGITEANLSLLKSGKVKGIRFSTLEAICAYLECQPGDSRQALGCVLLAEAGWVLALERFNLSGQRVELIKEDRVGEEGPTVDDQRRAAAH
jgi:putative transcriptional regulator